MDTKVKLRIIKTLVLLDILLSFIVSAAQNNGFELETVLSDLMEYLEKKRSNKNLIVILLRIKVIPIN